MGAVTAVDSGCGLLEEAWLVVMWNGYRGQDPRSEFHVEKEKQRRALLESVHRVHSQQQLFGFQTFVFADCLQKSRAYPCVARRAGFVDAGTHP